MKYIEFGPMEIKKQNDIYYSYLYIENGPILMKNNKVYTKIFKELIKTFPSIESVSFYDTTYTNYKIKTKGRRDIVINGIKKALLRGQKSKRGLKL